MIRVALPKGRNLEPALAALRAAGFALSGLEPDGRHLRVASADDGIEILLLKDWDLPLYVEHGVADCGFAGTDVLDEVDGDLIVPARIVAGRSRMSLVGRPGARPQPGAQVRLATKYPRTARRVVAAQPWGAEIVELHGSMELAPLLGLAELALDIVATGGTLRAHGLVEIEVVSEVAAALVVNRAAFQRHRAAINRLVDRLEAAGVAA